MLDALEVEQARVQDFSEYGSCTVEIPAVQSCLDARCLGIARQRDQKLAACQLDAGCLPRDQLQPILPAEIKMRFPVDVLSCRRAGAVTLELGELAADPCSTFLHPLRNECHWAIDGRSYQHAA